MTEVAARAWGSALRAAGQEGRQEQGWQARGALEQKSLDQTSGSEPGWVAASLVVFQQRWNEGGVVSGT